MSRCWVTVLLLVIIQQRFITIGLATTVSSQEPLEGQPFSIRCLASRVTFWVWYKDGSNININDPEFLVETIGDESTLSVETANHLVHTGHYQCVAVYWDSSESRFSFTVTVKYIERDIGIESEILGRDCTGVSETEQEVKLASSCGLRFLCTPPNGYPAISLSWYRDHVLLQETEKLEILENNTILMISNTTFDDSGSYECRASNELDITRQSSIITVLVQELGRGLRFTDYNTTVEGGMVKTVVEGELLKLTCTVEDNVGDVEFEWVTTELGGMEGEIVNISSTTNSTTLSVKKMLVEYEGIYSCMASDYFFSVTNNFTVAVQVPRAIVEWPPPEVQGREGETAHFECIATGLPLPEIIWFFKSTPVSSLQDLELQDKGNGSLVIPHLRPQHAGTYHCMFKKPPLNIHSFTLTVVEPNQPPHSSPTNDVTAPSRSNHFSIGSVNEVVTIVIISVCGVVLLLLTSGLLLFLLLCCLWTRKRRKERRTKERRKSAKESNLEVAIPAESYLFCSNNLEKMEKYSNSSGLPHGRRPPHRPLPPEPESEEDDNQYVVVVDVTRGSGVARMKLPSFSSDTSEAVVTELETVITDVSTD